MPTTSVDEVVREGLIWLARHQNPDGSWGALALKSRCVPEAPCYDATLRATDHYDVGLTGLALMCFLDAGFGPETEANLVDRSVDRKYQVGEVVQRGLDWLRQKQNPDGSFSEDRSFMYNEALATIAMIEAFGVTQKESWKDAAQKGVDFLQNAQRPNPSGTGSWGWRYSSLAEIQARPGSGRDEAYQKELYDSDTSVTGWCVLALARAHRRGLNVTQGSMDGGMSFCSFATAKDGLVGYLDAKGAGATVTGPFDDRFDYHYTTMSALGMCIRRVVEADHGDEFLRFAAKRLVGDLPRVTENHASIDYYYWHCGTLALHGYDGPDQPERTGRFWNPWEKALLEVVPSLQDHKENACSNGGWLVSDRWGSYTGAGPLYDTAINVLTLETLFRQ